MGIDQTQVIDLRSPAMQTFLLDNTETLFNEPVAVAPPNFHVDQERLLAEDVLQQKVSWIERETFNVFSGSGQFVSSFDVDVPFLLELKVATIAVLYIRNDVTDAGALAAIRNSLAGYDPTSGIDPLDWAREAMPPDLKGVFGQFNVRQRARITKTGVPSPNEDARNAILHRFSSVYGEKYRVIFASKVILFEVAEPAPSQFVREVGDPESMGSAIQAVTDIVDSQNAGNCEGLQQWQEPVADLFKIPEFKLTWELTEVTIGCVRVSLHLPVLYMREAVQQLWVYGAYPKDTFGLIGQMVKDCATFAVGAGVIVGLVSANFVAALKAFETVFTECMKQKVKELIRCVFPGLMILVNHTAWRRI